MQANVAMWRCSRTVQSKEDHLAGLIRDFDWCQCGMVQEECQACYTAWFVAQRHGCRHNQCPFFFLLSLYLGKRRSHPSTYRYLLPAYPFVLHECACLVVCVCLGAEFALVVTRIALVLQVPCKSPIAGRDSAPYLFQSL